MTKPGLMLPAEVALEIVGTVSPYVSRGGLKLEGAVREFGSRPFGSEAARRPSGSAPASRALEAGTQRRPAHAGGLTITGRVALDVGASTGGFTDYLLQNGARRVHAVDVGHGQLSPKLAADPRVIAYERTDIRKLDAEALGERVDLAVVDCSFIGVAKVIAHLPRFLTTEADVVALVKPQFEVGPGRVGRTGVVRDSTSHVETVEAASQESAALGFVELGRCRSPLPGGDGNIEFFLWLRATRVVHP